ncbi:MAG: DUF58 domain-containing protein, partial [Desulfurococcaceae archaeon]
ERICRKAVAIAKLAKAHFSTFRFGVVPSRVKGLGLEFIELREYIPGDDPRYIDWRASARLIKPDGDYRLVVREHLMEKFVNNIVILDYSKSLDYGDKIETAIFAITGLLSIAYFLNDYIDFLVFKGDKTIVRSGIDPLTLISYVLNIVCRLEPEGYTDLFKASHYLGNFKGRRTVFLVTDYAHHTSEFSFFIDAARGLGMEPIIIIVSTPLEFEAPDIDGFFELRDIEHPVKRALLSLSSFYEKVREYMIRIEASISKKNVKYVVFKGLRNAMSRKYVIPILYSETRIRKSFSHRETQLYI